MIDSLVEMVAARDRHLTSRVEALEASAFETVHDLDAKFHETDSDYQRLAAQFMPMPDAMPVADRFHRSLNDRLSEVEYWVAAVPQLLYAYHDMYSKLVEVPTTFWRS